MSKVIELNAEIWDKEVIKSDIPVVIDFWHQMCGWCLKLNPIFDQLPEHFENVKFGKMNILDSNENRETAMDIGVMGTPTIKIFCNGRDIGEMVGFRPIERLVSDLKEILDNKDECLAQSTPLE
ncbi:MAG: thioredoxin family protein [Candidatus Thorarchaeota archaeon]